MKKTLIAAMAVCANLGFETAPPANVAERNYEAEICSNGGGYDGAVINVGGYNQRDEFVHTPNFRLGNLGAGCAYYPHWWFRLHQSIEINVKNLGTDSWDRYFRNFAKCKIDTNHTSARFCRIP